MCCRAIYGPKFGGKSGTRRGRGGGGKNYETNPILEGLEKFGDMWHLPWEEEARNGDAHFPTLTSAIYDFSGQCNNRARDT